MSIEDKKFTIADLDLWEYHKEYLIEILNGEYSVEEAREDLQSLIDKANTQPQEDISNE